MTGTLRLRDSKVAFLEIPEGSTVKRLRMEGFTGFAMAKNPREYTRQYVDRSMEDTDVVGFSPSIAFNFDRHDGNPVHDYLAEIIDNELLGTAAVVNILIVDMLVTDPTANNCLRRAWSVIADTEGDSMDAYTHSGNFRVKGPKEWGIAEVSADGLEIEDWTEETV